MPSIRTLIITGVLAFLAALARGQDSPQKPDIDIRLTPVKTAYVLGEPVSIRCEMTNRSNRPVRVESIHKFPHPRHFQIAQDKPEAQFEVYRSLMPLFPHVTWSGVYEQWESGRQEVWFESLDFKTDANEGPVDAFPVVGKYRIRAVPVGGDGKGITSDPCEVEIKEPDERDVEALKFLQENELLGHLTERGENRSLDDAVVTKLKEFLGRFPASTYAPYARLGLGTVLIVRWHGRLDKAEKGKAELLDAAVPLLEEAGKSDNPAVGSVALMQLVGSFRTKDEPEKALFYAEECLRKFPQCKGRRHLDEALGSLRESAAKQKPDPAKPDGGKKDH